MREIPTQIFVRTNNSFPFNSTLRSQSKGIQYSTLRQSSNQEMKKDFYLAFTLVATTQAWVFPRAAMVKVAPLKSTSSDSLSLHGQNSCYLPIEQLEEDFFAPRIVQVRK